MKSALLLAVLAIPASWAGAQAVTEGELYYTTSSLSFLPTAEPQNPATVKKVSYNYNGSIVTLGEIQTINDSLSEAEGIVFTPQGKLLIGTGGPSLYELPNTISASATSINSGLSSATHLAISPDGNTAYVTGAPGGLSALGLPNGSAQTLSLSGDDTAISSLAFAQGGAAFYVASDAGGQNPHFGKLDLTTHTTTRLGGDILSGETLTYDPFTNNLFLFGGQSIQQVDPASGAIVSTLTLATILNLPTEMHQGITDGQGHLFASAGNGSLFFVDYSKSGKINDASNITQGLFSNEFSLRDIAPLVGPGSLGFIAPEPPGPTPIPLPAALWSGLSVLIGTGAVRWRRAKK